MIKMATVCDSYYQGGSWWRTFGPFSHLRKMIRNSGSDLHFEWCPPDQIRWSHVYGKDIVFINRPYHPIQHKVFTLAQDYQIPIWLDYDDYTMGIEYDNVTYDDYMSKESIDLQIRMIAQANIVTVSTYEMKKQLDRFRPHKDCLVVRNAVDFTLTPWNRPVDQGYAPVKRVLWRGSNHHQRDMQEAEDAFISAANEFKDFEFYFCGMRPWRIIENTKNCFHVSITDVTSYFKCLKGIRPDVVAVPLADTTFNKCKSNIAALEGAMAGGLPLVPNWPEWQIDGVVNYDKFADSLMSICQKLDKEIEFIRDRAKFTWQTVLENYDINTWNNRRLAVVEALANNDTHDFKTYLEFDKQEMTKLFGQLETVS